MPDKARSSRTHCHATVLKPMADNDVTVPSRYFCGGSFCFMSWCLKYFCAVGALCMFAYF